MAPLAVFTVTGSVEVLPGRMRPLTRSTSRHTRRGRPWADPASLGDPSWDRRSPQLSNGTRSFFVAW